ncbi:MAG: branched-chain amino acid transport system II carrier protein [Hyphomicrobiales bacterium]
MNKVKDIFIAGLALFAMFFGAGNLIFPPKLGANLGTDWMSGVLGFSLSDAGISFLVIVALALAGGRVQSIGERVHPKFGIGLGIVISLLLGPLLSVPRTGAVGFEMGFAPLVPHFNLLIFSAIYFGMVYYICKDSTNIIDKIGKILTPMLLLGLLVIVIKGIISPPSSPQPSLVSEGFGSAFLEGYQTVDGLGAVLLAGFVINSLRDKGYKKKSTILKITIAAGILASVLVTLIYASLMYLGSTHGPTLPADIGRSELFISMVNSLLGPVGMTFMALAVIMACFTTAVGLTATIARFYEAQTNYKYSYKRIVALMLLVSFGLSNLGVELIIKFAAPVLKIIYPIVVILVLMKLMDRLFKHNMSYRVAVIVCVLLSLPSVCASSGIHLPSINPSSFELPLVKWEMEWLMPSMLVAFLTEGIMVLKDYIVAQRKMSSIEIE